MEVLSRLLERRAKEGFDRTFIQIEEFVEETYGQCYERSLALANGLQQKLSLKKGEHVIIMSPTSIDFIHTWFAINMVGAVEVPINPAYKGDKLEYALNNSKARIAFIDELLIDRVGSIESQLKYLQTIIPLKNPSDQKKQIDPLFQKINVISFDLMKWEHPVPIQQEISIQDPATIIYTSGTTGAAKGVIMPYGQTYLLAKNAVDGLKITEEDICYTFLPLFHMAGKFMYVYAALISGSKVVLDTSFQPEAWVSRVRKYNATCFGAHGPFIQMIYQVPERKDDGDNPLRVVGSAPFPAKIAKDFERRFQVKGIEVWGMTEINCPCYHPYDEPLRLGSCGKVLEDSYELKIVDPDTGEELPAGKAGEILIRPKQPDTVSLGYFKMPEKTAEAWKDGWFHSGDIAYQDQDGYVYFVDRIKERIRRKAENISSYDIEVAVLIHPLVKECAAVGVPSDFDYDDEIKIYVVTKDGEVLAPEELIQYLVEKLPHYMVPRYIQFVKALPRTPTNKVQKAELLKQDHMGVDTWDRKAAGISVREISETLKKGH
ncbi:AMP-binding protein [Cytobacillus sp. Hz8]|uniref:AMP-binding protein n=1 Tax=Cytobacillus sp. Hz8 TaxID=3347168 RepID=UPI0035D77B54